MGRFDAYLIPAIDGVAYGLLLFTVAAPLTLIFGTGRVLNLAHGSLYALGAYIAAIICDGSWTSLLIAAAAGTLAGAAGGGLLSAALIPLAGRGHLAQALLTFGVALAADAALVLVFGPHDLHPKIPAGLDTILDLAGHPYPAYRLGFIAIAVMLAGAGWLVLTRSRAGARLRAMVDDQQMLACQGTDPFKVLVAVMIAGGGLAGLVGVLGAPIIGPGPGVADSVLLLSLAIVVVGRLGSVGGAVAAALGVGQVQTLGVVLAPTWTPYLLFAAMAAALLARPQPLSTGRPA